MKSTKRCRVSSQPSMIFPPMTEFCHLDGKTLPTLWQDFAIGMARLCQGGGKTLP